MTSILDLPTLLAPVSLELPTGKDLRQEDFAHSLYHKIKDARNALRNLERQQTQGAEMVVRPDWSAVYQLAIQALATETKDLEIAAWLLEALLREYGFAGLREGFKLARELINEHWDNLYPMPDEDGLITRLAPLTGLNGEETEGTLIVPVALVPLTQGRSIGPFSLWQYQQAIEIIKIADPDRRNQRLAAGAVTLEIIAQAVAETPPKFFQEQFQLLNSCIEEFKALTQVLFEKAGHDAPPSSRILAQLEACADCIKVIAKESLNIQTNTLSGRKTEQEKSLHDCIGSNISLSVDIHEISNSIISYAADKENSQPTREQILQTILYAADFFRQTEPHSPLSYLLERAVKWSKLPLPMLLKELIKDEQSLGYFCNLTGVSIDEKI